ncbi:MAG: hypothetical protein R2822_05845 [Spirosomataceae bacterium]
MKYILLSSLLLLAIFSSCTISRNSMREANYQLWLHHEDLELSPQVVGEAKQTKVLMVDWNRLLGRQYEYGQFGGLPSDPLAPPINGERIRWRNS